VGKRVDCNQETVPGDAGKAMDCNITFPEVFLYTSTDNLTGYTLTASHPVMVVSGGLVLEYELTGNSTTKNYRVNRKVPYIR
jgi:hypothetical protein